jgi:hypothetical protein
MVPNVFGEEDRCHSTLTELTLDAVPLLQCIGETLGSRHRLG